MPTLHRMKYFQAASIAARRAVEPDHQHGDQRRAAPPRPTSRRCCWRTAPEFMRDHHGLEHGVVEAQEARRQPAGLDLVPDIAGAEQRGREADEAVEHDEYALNSSTRSSADVSGRRPAGVAAATSVRPDASDVEPRRQPVAPDRRQHQRRQERQRQDDADRVDRKRRSSVFPAEAVERLQVDGVEALADVEDEDAEDDEGDQHREGDAASRRPAACPRRRWRPGSGRSPST